MKTVQVSPPTGRTPSEPMSRPWPGARRRRPGRWRTPAAGGKRCVCRLPTSPAAPARPSARTPPPAGAPSWKPPSGRRFARCRPPAGKRAGLGAAGTSAAAAFCSRRWRRNPAPGRTGAARGPTAVTVAGGKGLPPARGKTASRCSAMDATDACAGSPSPVPAPGRAWAGRADRFAAGRTSVRETATGWRPRCACVPATN